MISKDGTTLYLSLSPYENQLSIYSPFFASSEHSKTLRLMSKQNKNENLKHYLMLTILGSVVKRKPTTILNYCDFDSLPGLILRHILPDYLSVPKGTVQET